MAIRSGLGAQLGFAAESTYGTYVAPTRFLEFTTEGLDISQEPIASQGSGRARPWPARPAGRGTSRAAPAR